MDKFKLQDKYGKNLFLSESLAKYNWFNLGGEAEIFFKPENIEQLSEFLKDIYKDNVKFFTLGAGSNTLIRDKGIRGSVIKLGSKFSQIKLLDENQIEVGAGLLDRKVSDFATNNMISKMEFLSCIPGSIGGAIAMNSGCYGSEISDLLESIKVIDETGKTKNIKKDQIKFHYRGTNLPNNLIILSAILKGAKSTKSEVQRKQNELIQKKKISQPSRIKTGGSTFKNIKNKKAWELIKEAGGDKFFVGDAKISEQHCNFFINNGNAKTEDMEELINKVRKQVKLKTGVDLELEIKIIGDEN